MSIFLRICAFCRLFFVACGNARNPNDVRSSLTAGSFARSAEAHIFIACGVRICRQSRALFHGAAGHGIVLPKGIRGASRVGVKGAGKIGLAVESAALADSSKLQPMVGEQCFGFFAPEHIDIMHAGVTRDLLEFVGKIIFAQADKFGNFIQRQVGGVDVGADKTDGLLDAGEQMRFLLFVCRVAVCAADANQNGKDKSADGLCAEQGIFCGLIFQNQLPEKSDQLCVMKGNGVKQQAVGVKVIREAEGPVHYQVIIVQVPFRGDIVQAIGVQSDQVACLNRNLRAVNPDRAASACDIQQFNIFMPVRPAEILMNAKMHLLKNKRELGVFPDVCFVCTHGSLL